jgi:hypothetical protein
MTMGEPGQQTFLPMEQQDPPILLMIIIAIILITVKKDGMPKCPMRRKLTILISCVYPNNKRKLQQL